MHKNTTIFNFNKLPGGFLIAASLLIITEMLLYSFRTDMVDDYWNKFIVNEHELIDTDKDYSYLIMGDSLQKTGINPTLISDELLNLGLPGSKPMGLCLLLERYLKKHKPPKIIFLYVNPENAQDSLFVILRYFVALPEFISLWRDLTWDERRCFILKYWVSLDERRVRLTVRDKYPYNNETFVKEMKKNHGYMPSPRYGQSIEHDYFVNHRARYQFAVAFSRTDLKYLDKFMVLASSKNIKVVFLGLLLPNELTVIFEKIGFNRNYHIFIDILKKRYPDAYFVSDPIQHLDNKYFCDQSHLNKEGSLLYSQYFKESVFMPYVKAIEGKSE